MDYVSLLIYLGRGVWLFKKLYIQGVFDNIFTI